MTRPPRMTRRQFLAMVLKTTTAAVLAAVTPAPLARAIFHRDEGHIYLGERPRC